MRLRGYPVGRNAAGAQCTQSKQCRKRTIAVTVSRWYTYELFTDLCTGEEAEEKSEATRRSEVRQRREGGLGNGGRAEEEEKAKKGYGRGDVAIRPKKGWKGIKIQSDTKGHTDKQLEGRPSELPLEGERRGVSHDESMPDGDNEAKGLFGENRGRSL